MNTVTIHNLSPGAFDRSATSPHKISTPNQGALPGGVDHSAGGSKGAFDIPPVSGDPIPGPITREQVGQKIDMIV